MAGQTQKDRAAAKVAGSASGEPPDRDSNQDASVLYDELVASRDRLAGLRPLTPHDLECVAQAMHEVIWYLITPPRSAKTNLPLSDLVKRRLLVAAHNREADLFVAAVALVARKIGTMGSLAETSAVQLDLIRDALDALTFDYHSSKRTTLALLRDLKSDIETRIAYLTASRKEGYRFQEQPENYRDRRDKTERPDQFFRRVYGGHVPRGLTQADIRRTDPAFYNVLHVWCTRHDRRLSSLVPATRPRRS